MVAPALLSKVLQKALQVATHSWEYGTVAEALLEWNNASLSIWNTPFPSGSIPLAHESSVPALQYAKSHIALDGNTLINADGSSADPASLGVYAVMLGATEEVYATAAKRQADHLLYSVPRYDNGAISHRESVGELWADFIYMVPPFLAYHAVSTSSLSGLKEAANQCRLYGEVLGTESGLWRHIIGPNWSDRGLWSTGNAWAVAGMSRVLATMRHSNYAGETMDEQKYLAEGIKRIVDATIAIDTSPSGLLLNYLDDASWFGEISGTALIAAAVFRMKVLEPGMFGEERYMEWATRKRQEVSNRINQDTGIVGPAVNPLKWDERKEFWAGSPEGQAFVVLMEAAWRDLKG
ncbi:hypothetical protein P154DRAFT_496654 [Amniculicola lignicola CBS 123094]|uniref:Six-hairpin glycosidase n=1 Tax=Amniculicola lignicola CBS 123094 TaxID=1392246 RepID=A0A6A5W8E3_9PLEO|nr:hypothetical protein P154DRAFT_496654 [Amniculicola lignicola CBS 123094]